MTRNHLRRFSLSSVHDVLSLFRIKSVHDVLSPDNYSVVIARNEAISPDRP